MKQKRIQIREYRSEDLEEIAKLFYRTVHSVCAKDYTQEQLDAWASGTVDLEEWDRSFLDHYTLVAEECDSGKVAGFGDINNTGYLDRLYIHRDYQRQGIASELCDRLETHFPVKIITTHASITARPFFEKRGYQVIKEQRVERKGVLLTNFIMEKRFIYG